MMFLQKFTRLGVLQKQRCLQTSLRSKPLTYQLQRCLSNQLPIQSANQSTGGNKLVSVDRICGDTNMYHLRWEDATVQKYPFVWLRDCCQCHECHHLSSYQRKYVMKNLDPDIIPSSQHIDADKSMFYVTWPEGHVGEYQTDWLIQHKFDQANNDAISHLKSRPWGPEDIKTIPTFDYATLMEDDKTLFDWLHTLFVKGFSLVTDAPRETGVIHTIARKIGYLRKTNYGETFQILNTPDGSNVAFTALEIGKHCDLPYYKFPPGVQMLHCITQTETAGGGNEFCDGYAAAEILRKENPYLYELLCKTPISFRDCGDGEDGFPAYHMMQSRPMFELDSDGDFLQVYVNDPTRSNYMNVPVDLVRDMYKGMKEFNRIINRKENNLQVKLKSGEIAVFNNTRVLHGRIAYESNPDGPSAKTKERYFEGGYMDWDQIQSTLRVLYEQCNGELRI